METDNQPLDSGLSAQGPVDSLQVTPVVKGYWREIAFWALFFAILGFISLFFSAASNFLLAAGDEAKSGLFGQLLFLPVVAIPYWFLFKFAASLRQSLERESTALAETGFVYLRRFYQFVGVLAILFLGLFLLGFFTFIFTDLNS